MRRAVSVLLYLNPGWRPEWGGELRISDESAPEGRVDVVPEAGTLVLMRSADVAHEVLPTRRPRQCVVGWLRTAEGG